MHSRSAALQLIGNSRRTDRLCSRLCARALTTSRSSMAAEAAGTLVDWSSDVEEVATEQHKVPTITEEIEKIKKQHRKQAETEVDNVQEIAEKTVLGGTVWARKRKRAYEDFKNASIDEMNAHAEVVNAADDEARQQELSDDMQQCLDNITKRYKTMKQDIKECRKGFDDRQDKNEIAVMKVWQAREDTAVKYLREYSNMG